MLSGILLSESFSLKTHIVLQEILAPVGIFALPQQSQWLKLLNVWTRKNAVNIF